MKIDRILYRRNFLINPTTMEHRHIGVEVLLDEFDNIDEVYLKAKSKVEEWATGLMEGTIEAPVAPLPEKKLDLGDSGENEALKRFWAEKLKVKLTQ